MRYLSVGQVLYGSAGYLNGATVIGMKRCPMCKKLCYVIKPRDNNTNILMEVDEQCLAIFRHRCRWKNKVGNQK